MVVISCINRTGSVNSNVLTYCVLRNIGTNFIFKLRNDFFANYHYVIVNELYLDTLQTKIEYHSELRNDKLVIT